jgi:hypothetical protein
VRLTANVVFQFKFFNAAFVRGTMSDVNNARIGDEELYGHMDPFYAECRAYGRIMEVERKQRRKRSLVVPCYGFLGIPAKKEQMLSDRFGVYMWDREVGKVSSHEPLRALVKELDEVDLPLTHTTLNRILKDLRAIRKMGIYQQDVFARNYKGGRLVDFSASFTEPHFMLKIRSPLDVGGFKIRDLVMFDEMVEQSGTKTWIRALPNDRYLGKLRSHRSETPIGE